MAMPEAHPGGQTTTIDAFLGGRLLLRQPSSGYRAGLDAVVLAATVPAPASGRMPPVVADLGAGVGAVGLSAATRLAEIEVVLVEREPALLALCADNIARNGLGARARTIAVDLAAAAASELDALGLTADSFDHVVANPPFYVEGEGRISPDPLKARAHVMAAGGIERWVRTMARLVRPGGTATMIHRADALPDMLAAFAGRFGDLAVLPIHPRAGALAGRVVVAGRKGSRAGARLLAGLVTHAPEGHGFTPTLDAILRHGAGLDLWSAEAPLLVPGNGAD